MPFGLKYRLLHSSAHFLQQLAVHRVEDFASSKMVAGGSLGLRSPLRRGCSVCLAAIVIVVISSLHKELVAQYIIHVHHLQRTA